MNYSASVAICTRNRVESLKMCLEHLRRQTFPLLEIVIVDNSDADTHAEVDAFAGGVVRVIRFDGGLGSLPAMRNVALNACKGDIVAFLDDDGYPSAEWMEELIRTFDKKSAAGVTGRIIQGTAETHVSGQPYNCGRFSPARGVFGNFNYICDEIFEVDQFQGTNMAFVREALLAAGGWDPAINGGYGSSEDLSVCLAIKNSGGTLYYNQKAMVVHGEVPREAGIKRELASSESFAKFNTKCYTYLMLKYGYFQKYSYADLLSIAYRLKRCFLPASAIPLLDRAKAARGVIKGHQQGISLYRRHQK